MMVEEQATIRISNDSLVARLRFSLVLAVVLSLVLASATIANGQDLADTIAKCEKSVVKIEVTVGKGGDSLGSGFVVERTGVIVTNVHVLAGASKARAKFSTGEWIEIEGTYYIDESRDICIAKLKGDHDLKTLTLLEGSPRKGDQVTALGSPHGLEFSVSNGIDSAIRSGVEIARDAGRNGLKGTWVQVDAALSSGNSGGPLVDRNGEVVAMSTLASQGAAQNLNFGISSTDIALALKTSDTKALIGLRAGVGAIRPRTAGGQDRRLSGDGEAGYTGRKQIADAAFRDYADRCLAQWDDLLLSTKRLESKAEVEWRAMKKGKPYSNNQSPIFRTIWRNGTIGYAFHNERVKENAVKRQKAELDEIKAIRAQLTAVPNKDSLLALMKLDGPFLDTRDEGTIGFMRNAMVLRPINEHEVIAAYDNAEYLLWLESTAGLSKAGQVIEPVAVYVAGSRVIENPTNRQRVVATILHAVTEKELERALLAHADQDGVDGQQDKSEVRTWTSSGGGFAIQGSFIDSDGETIRIRREDGSVISVKIKKLSDADLNYVTEQRKKK